MTSIGPANFADRTEVGLAVVTPSRKDDPALRQWALRAKRMGTSGSDTHDFMQALLTAMRRRWAELEPIEGAPPVMLLRRRDASDMADQQWWSRIFPEGECVTIEGADHEITALDAGLIAEMMAGIVGCSVWAAAGWDAGQISVTNSASAVMASSLDGWVSSQSA